MSVAFSTLLVVCGLTLSFMVTGQHLPLPPLPYGYSALEPHMDEATLTVHHLGHHKAYTDKLNTALEAMRWDDSLKWMPKMGIDSLLTRLADVPEEFRATIRNAGGGYVNHALFWQMMSPQGGGEPSNATREGQELNHAIETTFGSVDAFKKAFSSEAVKVFGSGWTWLVFDSTTRALGIENTLNQDTPASVPSKFPVLALDMWEHAYYLRHQNNKSRYVDAFWNVINWEEVARRYHAASHGLTNDVVHTQETDL